MYTERTALFWRDFGELANKAGGKEGESIMLDLQFHKIFLFQAVVNQINNLIRETR